MLLLGRCGRGFVSSALFASNGNHRLLFGIVPATTTSTSGTALRMSSSAPSSTTGAAGDAMSREEKAMKITGLPLGPYPIGVTTVQINASDGGSGVKGGRGLQTEIWYPATDESTAGKPVTRFSEYLGLDGANDPVEALATANAAIGGYRDGITIEELDSPERSTWITNAVRDAEIRVPDAAGNRWPLVVFSHGAGAYRASYSFWTEFLASHGYAVAACDHPGSARYTIVDGEVITPHTPGSPSGRRRMEEDRPRDVLRVVDGIESRLNAERFGGAIDAGNVAITGMSFGGFSVAAALELGDPRVRAAVTMCASSNDGLHLARGNRDTPVMCMIATEDAVLGPDTTDSNRKYAASQSGADSYLLEIKRGGHVSFTSCEMYDPEYGNGIAAAGRCPKVDGTGTFRPLDIVKQHEIMNSYGLAFLNKYLKKSGDSDDDDYLKTNQFSKEEVIFVSKPK